MRQKIERLGLGEDSKIKEEGIVVGGRIEKGSTFGTTGKSVYV